MANINFNNSNSNVVVNDGSTLKKGDVLVFNRTSSTVNKGTILTYTSPLLLKAKIQVAGARGGSGGGGSYGKGATISGETYLSAGEKLKVLVGHYGGAAPDTDNCGGGGGGTFVAFVDPNSSHILSTTNERVSPLIIAGGGAPSTSDGSGTSGVFEEVPVRNTVGAGHGGQAVSATGSAATSNNHGSGGGGFRTGGSVQANGTLEAGYGFLQGGNGGNRGASSSGGIGGFGGGAGTIDEYGGGGGGYSGGTGGDGSSTGGGSYTHSRIFNRVNINLTNDGDGQCRITYLGMLKVNSLTNLELRENKVLNFTLNTTDTFGSETRVLKIEINGKVYSTTTTRSGSISTSLTLTKDFPNTQTDYTVKAWVEVEGAKSNVVTSKINIDGVAPIVSFPTETYNVQHYEGETITLFTATDATDTSLDYDYKVYVDNQLYTSQLNVKGNTLKLPYFDSMPESYQLKVEVRAKQSADTVNGIGKDVWSDWYTSPTITIKSPVIFSPTFNSIKWYQDVEQQAIVSPYSSGTFETQHYCNGELFTTTQHRLGLTPPLLYTPIKPHLWSYEYYARTRVQNTEGMWSGWYTSPTVEVQFNVQPNDIEFNKELPPYFIQGEVTTVEWKESTDPNVTKITYTASLMNNTTEELFEITGIEEPRLTFTVPDDIVSNNITFSIVAYSDGLYSNPVSSPNMAITDVKIMDCNLDFPVLNTNVTGQVTEFILEINGDRRISKAENFTNYTIPLHYFRKGENKLTLIAKDRNGVEVTRTWKVNLDFNNTNLIPLDTIEVEGYMSFNHNEVEQYVPCTTLFKSNLDLGVVEHELYGSTTFEGANTVTQKLVIKRDVNDDLTQLRTLKITGAIE